MKASEIVILTNALTQKMEYRASDDIIMKNGKSLGEELKIGKDAKKDCENLDSKLKNVIDICYTLLDVVEALCVSTTTNAIDTTIIKERLETLKK